MGSLGCTRVGVDERGGLYWWGGTQKRVTRGPVGYTRKRIDTHTTSEITMCWYGRGMGVEGEGVGEDGTYGHTESGIY